MGTVTLNYDEIGSIGNRSVKETRSFYEGDKDNKSLIDKCFLLFRKKAITCKTMVFIHFKKNDGSCLTAYINSSEDLENGMITISSSLARGHISQTKMKEKDAKKFILDYVNVGGTKE